MLIHIIITLHQHVSITLLNIIRITTVTETCWLSSVLFIQFQHIHYKSKRYTGYRTGYITQNTYFQSWTVTEIMAREKCWHLAFPRTVRLQLCRALTLTEQCSRHLCVCTSYAQCDKIVLHYCQIFMRYVQCLVTLRTTMTWVRVFL